MERTDNRFIHFYFFCFLHINCSNQINLMNARTNHDIDFKIYGEEMQYVEVELDPEETAIAEAGSFMMMDDGVQMETIFGDGSRQQTGGLLGKLMSAGKRVLTGESLFMTAYTNIGQGKKKVSFASPYPGKIIPVDLMEYGGRVICQKDAFLCAAKGVSVGIALQRRLGTGLFGGEGLFFAILKGPGKVWMQTLPVSRLASRILAYGTFNRKEEGSLLGGLGNLLDGDGR
jgi:uncharacterized protein (AIM24 family)